MVVVFFADSLRVVKTFTGDLALTVRANLRPRWLRRKPVLREDVRFLGLPMCIKLLLFAEIYLIMLALILT